MDLIEATLKVSGAVQNALKALQDPNCKRIFGSNIKDPVSGGFLDPETVLKGILNGAHGSFAYAYQGDADAVVATTQGEGLSASSAGLYYRTVKVTINMDVFNAAFAKDATTAILHELGHAMNFLSAGIGSKNNFEQYDGIIGNGGASQRNTSLVERDCTNGLFQ